MHVCARPARLITRTLIRAPPLARRHKYMSAAVLAPTARASENVDPSPPAKMPRLEDQLRVKKISEHATLPARGSDGAAGYDLASAYDYGAIRCDAIRCARGGGRRGISFVVPSSFGFFGCVAFFSKVPTRAYRSIVDRFPRALPPIPNPNPNPLTLNNQQLSPREARSS